jgi:hypothetical protein
VLLKPLQQLMIALFLIQRLLTPSSKIRNRADQCPVDDAGLELPTLETVEDMLQDALKWKWCSTAVVGFGSIPECIRYQCEQVYSGLWVKIFGYFCE